MAREKTHTERFEASITTGSGAFTGFLFLEVTRAHTRWTFISLDAAMHGVCLQGNGYTNFGEAKTAAEVFGFEIIEKLVTVPSVPEDVQ